MHHRHRKVRFRCEPQAVRAPRHLDRQCLAHLHLVLHAHSTHPEPPSSLHGPGVRRYDAEVQCRGILHVEQRDVFFEREGRLPCAARPPSRARPSHTNARDDRGA